LSTIRKRLVLRLYEIVEKWRIPAIYANRSHAAHLLNRAFSIANSDSERGKCCAKTTATMTGNRYARISFKKSDAVVRAAPWASRSG
jgi:hypothetical protein